MDGSEIVGMHVYFSKKDSANLEMTLCSLTQQ